MKQPKYLNEWMNELLSKINPDDATTSQICALFCGAQRCDWDKIESIDLAWKEYGINCNYAIKPVIHIEFYP